MDGDRAGAGSRAQPGADVLAVQGERRGGATLVSGPVAACEQRPVRHADGRQVERRAEVQRQAGAARMVAAGGVDEHDVGALRQRLDRRLQQRSLA
jgi:hypothetical protein